MISSLSFFSVSMGLCMQVRTLSLLFVCLFILVRSASASPFDCGAAPKLTEEDKLTAKIEERYSRISDLSARFIQESYFLGSDEHRQSQGRMSFQRPGKMDWDYDVPDEQRFTSDGETVWWAQPKSNQVIVRNLQSSFTSDVPVSFLLGVGKLRESFSFQSKCVLPEGILVSLKPRASNTSMDVFYLLVDSKDFSPLGARMVDVGGNETSIFFKDRKFNAGVESDRFEVKIPKGTDVIDERSKTSNSANPQ